MALSRPLLIALLLSLAGCQTFFADRAPSRVATERLQGEVRLVDGQLQFQTHASRPLSDAAHRFLRFIRNDTHRFF